MKHILFFILPVLLLCSACKDEVKQVKHVPAHPVTVAVTQTFDCLPFFVADEMQMDTTLLLSEQLSKAACAEAVMHGKACAAMVDYVHADALKHSKALAKLLSKKSRKDTVTILSHNNLIFYFMTNAKARLREASQLQDKMIAVDRQGADAIMAQHILDSVRLSNNKAFLIQMQNIQTRYNMILNNSMDAAVLTEPHASILRGAGHPSLYSAYTHKGRPFGAFVATSHSALLQQLYNRACDSINRNGIHHYDSILVKRLHVPQKLLRNIPEHKFKKI